MNYKVAKSIAGMSIGGGRKENFFLCLIEYYPDQERSFVKTIKQVKDEEDLDRDEVITYWVDHFEIHNMIVDFPQTQPLCLTCDLDCPGVKKCIHPKVEIIRNDIEKILNEDAQKLSDDPKEYEKMRVSDLQIDRNKPDRFLLTRSYKRKLKKGFIPYWNRPIDYNIWNNFYDKMLELFNISYDSFGNVSIKLINKFNYLLKHLPTDLIINESSIYIILIKLIEQKIITKQDVELLSDLERSPIARINLVRAIEKKFDLFIYEKDLELIAKNSKAFESFILALSGHELLRDKVTKIKLSSESSFIIPHFS